MSETTEIVERSRLAAPPAEVWSVVSTMEGVNHELAPLVRMSVPRALRGRPLSEAPLGEVAFRSWLLAGGVLPFDRHALCLVEIDADGGGFRERSTTWLQALWEHERRLTPCAGGTQIVDRVRVEPRVGLARGLTRRIVARVFAHRHRRLRARFGEL